MQIEIQGIDRLIAKLGRVQANDVLENPMKRAQYRIVNYMAWYPEVPDSKYKRTNTLKRKWAAKKIERLSDGIQGKVINDAESPKGVKYGPWVQSDRFQTRTHRQNGHRTDRMALDTLGDTIVADFQQEINRALNS